MSEVSDISQPQGLGQDRYVARWMMTLNRPARSLELEEASGVPATAIFGDVDTFERQHKARYWFIHHRRQRSHS